MCGEKMNIGRMLGEALELSQELDDLHKYITDRQLPVKKSDDFYKQCILLEEYVGSNTFKSYHKKMKNSNLLSGLIAAPVTIAIIILIAMDKFSKNFDAIQFYMDSVVLQGASGVLFVMVIAVSLYFYYIKNKLHGEIYTKLKQQLNMI